MEEQLAGVAKAFGDVFTVVGTPQAVEEVGVRIYGSRSEVAYFVVPCQRGAAFIRIVSVKRGDNQRIVSSVAVATQPEGIFPSALLEPEAQQRR